MPNTETALARAPEQFVVNVMDAMEKRSVAFLDLLGSDEAVRRFKQVALHSIVSDNKLWTCDPLSIVEACRESASLGLEPTGLLGEGYIIPRGKTAKFAPGWQGYLKLIRNSGEVAKVDCQVVYEKDSFSIEYGTQPRVYHVPYLMANHEDDRGSYVGAYAWALLNNGQMLIEWMPYVEIEQARKFSEAKQGPWGTWWGEMARKTVLRRFQKRLPKSPQMARAMLLDAELDQDIRDAEAAAAATPVSPARAKAVKALEARYPGVAAPAPAPVEEAPESGPDLVEETSEGISDEELDRLTAAVEP